MNRKVFIDCGFFIGSALTYFQQTPEYANDFIYYGFDPMLKENIRKQFPNVTLDSKALWLFDGEIEFFTSNRHGGRANGIFHNRRAHRENNLKVPCIDFSKWLKSNFDSDDTIILKMDVEGAEYQIIPHLIESGAINLIKIIYLEWHAGRIGDNKWEETTKLANQLKLSTKLIVRQSLERYLRSLNRTKK